MLVCSYNWVCGGQMDRRFVKIPIFKRTGTIIDKVACFILVAGKDICEAFFCFFFARGLV